jgi:hypothetical protein
VEIVYARLAMKWCGVHEQTTLLMGPIVPILYAKVNLSIVDFIFFRCNFFLSSDISKTDEPKPCAATDHLTCRKPYVRFFRICSLIIDFETNCNDRLQIIMVCQIILSV